MYHIHFSGDTFWFFLFSHFIFVLRSCCSLHFLGRFCLPGNRFMDSGFSSFLGVGFHLPIFSDSCCCWEVISLHSCSCTACWVPQFSFLGPFVHSFTTIPFLIHSFVHILVFCIHISLCHSDILIVHIHLCPIPHSHSIHSFGPWEVFLLTFVTFLVQYSISTHTRLFRSFWSPRYFHFVDLFLHFVLLFISGTFMTWRVIILTIPHSILFIQAHSDDWPRFSPIPISLFEYCFLV